MFDENDVAENLANAFGYENENNNDLVKLKVVSVGSVSTLTAHKGDTIGDLKEENGYDETIKITNASGIPLRNDFVIEGDMTLYVSVPKENG